MINKKLDDIIKDIEEIKKVFNSTDYFKKLEEVINKQNNHNKELELKINNLQSKIDKANKILDKHFQDDEGIVYKITGEHVAERNEKFIEKLRDILKEDK